MKRSLFHPVSLTYFHLSSGCFLRVTRFSIIPGVGRVVQTIRYGSWRAGSSIRSPFALLSFLSSLALEIAHGRIARRRFPCRETVRPTAGGVGGSFDVRCSGCGCNDGECSPDVPGIERSERVNTETDDVAQILAGVL